MKRWEVAPRNPDAIRALSGAGISSLTAHLLHLRGVRTAEEARRFLAPDLEHLQDPFALDDMDRAVERFRAAIRAREKIGIFGDYDVDGIAGASILQLFFRLFGTEATLLIPNRLEDGYGLTARAVDHYAARGVRLLFTTDCGTTARPEIERALDHGMDVIVLDHHEETGPLPPSVAFVNPKRSGSRYPFRELCSSAIAFKFCWAVSRREPAGWKQTDAYRSFLFNSLSLAALATIADVAPLTGENRVLVRFGLEAFRAAPCPGLRLLLEKGRISPDAVTVTDLAFRVIPKINAIGRMGDARSALDLFLESDPRIVRDAVERAEKANRDRRAAQDSALEEAFSQVESQLAEERPIVVTGKAWHPGVLGLVAARLAEKYSRPAFALTHFGKEIRGSGRSTGSINLARLLDRVRQALPSARCGGHAQAAGVVIPKEDLEKFLELVRGAALETGNGTAATERLSVDDEVPLRHLTPTLCREIEKLAPHGNGNPEPILVSRGIRLAGEPRLVRDRHVSFFADDGTCSVRVVAFDRPSLIQDLPRAAPFHLAYTPGLCPRAFGGGVELTLKDLHPA